MGLRLSGLATGLDTSALVSALLQFERRPLDLLQQRRDGVAEQQAAFREVNSLLLELRDAARAVDNRNDFLTGGTLDEEFLDYSVSTSDSGLATANVSGNATEGTTPIRVLELASVGRRFTVALPSDDGPIWAPGATVQIGFGGDDDIDITVGPDAASLRDMASLINTDANNDGNVLASVLYDGTNYRLVISGVQTGVANDLDVSMSPDLMDATLDQNASDAQLEVYGVAVTRSSNTVDDVVAGVGITLTGTTDAGDPNDVVNIVVERDDSAMKAKLQTIADTYNKFHDMVSKRAGFDAESGKSGILAGDSTLRGVERQLQRIIGTAYDIGTNPLTGLGQIGLAFDKTGKLELDDEVFTAAMDDDPLQVRELLSGDDTTDGVATALVRALDPILLKSSASTAEEDPDSQGLLAVRDQGFAARLSGLDRQIERFEERLGKREESLIRTYSRLESTIARLQAQQNYLQSAF